eukprot:403332347
MQQQSYLQELRNKQIHELQSFFQELQLMSSNAQKTEYRVPITIAVSRTPLFIRIDLLPNFPQQAPIVQVLARVLHPDLHPQRKTYQGKAMTEWGLHSSLLNLIRGIQSDFNKTPPIPESQQQAQIQQQQQHQPLMQQMPQQNLQPGANHISQQDAQKLQRLQSMNRIEDKLKEMVQPPKQEQIMALINNLNYEELQEMQENEQYLKDFIHEREELQKYQRDCEKIADQANVLATENIQKFDEMQKLMEENQKLMKEYDNEKLRLEKAQRKMEELKLKHNPQTL